MEASLGIPQADPHFGCPAGINLLLEVDIFVSSLLHGQQIEPPGSPMAFETKFGWVLAGFVELHDCSSQQITTHHASLTTGDALLC